MFPFQMTRGIALVIACILSSHWAGLAARKIEPWETSILYQVYPRSFKDSNGDGTGDLPGILEKLDYIKDIGVDIIWIQPFYKSGGADMGYDVSDYKSVDPLFGTLDDFKKLVKGIHDRGMTLMLDFVPNHASDENEWFKLSEQSIEPYKDYFVWKDGKISNGQRVPPNNWLSVFGGSAWTWSDKRKQYYFRQFAVKQPDLNFLNPKVMEEMSNVLRFWLDLGVDGFRVDAIKHLVEASHLMDEPVFGPDPTNYAHLRHIYTMKQPENYVITHEWRMILKEYEAKDGRPRLLCVEDYDHPSELARYLGNETYPNIQIPSNYMFEMAFTYTTNAKALDDIVRMWVDVIPQKAALPNWAIGNHDNPRVSSRYHPDSVDSINMLLLMLPGMAIVYYGEEIGHEDSIVRPDQRQDPNNGGMGRTDTRDAERGPMIWDDTNNAGFTTNEKPWLPVTPNYWRLNVKNQLQEPNSHLKIFKRLVA